MAVFPASGDSGKVQRTFRLKKNTLSELDRIAKEMNVPVNQLADDCIIDGLIHIVLKRDVHAITIGREDMMSILEQIESIEKIKELGEKLGRSVPKRLYALHNVEPSWKAVLSALDQVHGKACGWFVFKHYSQYDDRADKEIHRLIFTHDGGVKWTVFVEGYLTGMIRTLLKTEPKIGTVTDKMLELTA
jgi:hypothetical protein